MHLTKPQTTHEHAQSFGADPFLSGEATYEAIMGVQSQGVQATVKHALLK
jgi:beta-glucosidase